MTLSKKLGVVPLIAFAIFLQSCDDFFVPNIEDKEVTILAPADGYSSQSQTVTFWWEKLDGATHYQIQVVTPGFNDPRRIDVDTTITGYQLVKLLLPGSYQWRIRGVNSAYTTPYKTYSLTVEYNSDLTEQEVVLKSPVDSFYTNTFPIVFSWFDLVAAEKYVYELRTSAGGAVVNPFETTNTEVTVPGDIEIPDISDGFYRWSVRAMNWFSFTPPATRTFGLDRVNPGKPMLTLPSHNDTLEVGYITFQWQRTQTSIAPQFDTLYILDQNGEGLEKHFSDNSSATISLPKGSYQWQVCTFDKAGNKGEPSDIRMLWVIETGSDLTDQSVTLLEPEDNSYTNNLDFSFIWGPIPTAEKYTLYFKNIVGVNILLPTETTSSSLAFSTIPNYQLVPDGTYKWSVVASNWFSYTLPSERTQTIDRVNPAIPLLVLPENKDTLSTGVIHFEWQRPGSSLAPIFDSLYIKTKEGQTVAANHVDGVSHEFALSAGEFIWYVKSFDAAGNSSGVSETRELRIEP